MLEEIITLNPNKWIDNYADYLFNYAVVRVNDSDLAKDLVQETFFAGLKSAKNFEGKATERTWLVSILKRKVIDHYRKINSNKGKAEKLGQCIRKRYRKRRIKIAIRQLYC
jgi:RNA polymerase sigma factor (sigma-70 family)